jgi:hypothetical protein
MADEMRRSTAQWLGAFKKELDAEGLDPDTVKYLVQVAGREQIERDGICVKEVGRDG